MMNVITFIKLALIFTTRKYHLESPYFCIFPDPYWYYWYDYPSYWDIYNDDWYDWDDYNYWYSYWYYFAYDLDYDGDIDWWGW